MEKQMTTAMAQAGMLTREQLMKELDLGDDALRVWERAGLPRVKPSGRYIFYHVPAVVKWMLKRKPQR